MAHSRQQQQQQQLQKRLLQLQPRQKQRHRIRRTEGLSPRRAVLSPRLSLLPFCRFFSSSSFSSPSTPSSPSFTFSLPPFVTLLSYLVAAFTIISLPIVPTVAATTTTTTTTTSTTHQSSECPSGTLTFELITGHVYTSPADTVTMIPGVLHLSECLEHCRSNQSCQSLNFETGLCVLLSSSALQRPFALTPSQFPVFTIYAHKVCLTGLNDTCAQSGWAFERVRGFELREHERRMVSAHTRQECMQACVDEHRFTCRSANFEDETHECWLSDMDRNTINVNNEVRSKKYGPSSGSIDYLEYNCVKEPRKMCDFKPLEGKILKTVDSVYQDVKNLEECQQRCLTGQYKCHSYDFGDPKSPVCRTSHLDKVALAHIENPYIEIAGAVTYELQNCYDVAILCRSKEMVAKVRSSKIFDGKIYAKRKPHHCMTDVNDSLEFEIHMSYNDLECDVKQPGRGQYSNDIVIQHHDLIVTTSDLGLNINCRYDLSNKSISNNVNLAIDGNLQAIGTHASVVGSPNVTMKITDESGASVRAARVGDSLTLRFEIADTFSPYELFVRELVALDGTDMSEFMLIDGDGCPTDLAIMAPIEKSGSGGGQILETRFEAFKFPTSDLVQFKALVTPCVANCEPSRCNLSLPSGRTSQTLSYGRRRRRRETSGDDDQSSKGQDSKAPVLEDSENVVVIESLSVTDKFTAPKNKQRKKIEEDDHSEVFSSFEEDLSNSNLWNVQRTSRLDEPSSSCLSLLSVTIFSVAFLIAQTVLLISWSIVCSRRRQNQRSSLLENEMMYGGSSNWSVRGSCGLMPPPPPPAPRATSLPSGQQQSGKQGHHFHSQSPYTDSNVNHLYPSVPSSRHSAASFNIYS